MNDLHHRINNLWFFLALLTILTFANLALIIVLIYTTYRP